jgi:poly-D-alanine transfer protein DltD
LLWDINKDLNVEICIDGKVVNTSFIPKKNGYHTIQLPIEHNQLYVLKDKIKITINGWIIPEGEIKKNLKSSIEACYNE